MKNCLMELSDKILVIKRPRIKTELSCWAYFIQFLLKKPSIFNLK